MIDLAKEKVKKIKKTNGKFIFQKKNILKIKKFKKANLFYSILLFPFLSLSERNKLLKKISESLHSDGALISVEKLDQIIVILKIYLINFILILKFNKSYT